MSAYEELTWNALVTPMADIAWDVGPAAIDAWLELLSRMPGETEEQRMMARFAHIGILAVLLDIERRVKDKKREKEASRN